MTPNFQPETGWGTPGESIMYDECRHIMPSGRKCHSPALSGKAWCYYHQNLHSYGKPPQFNDKFTYFPIEDAHGIQIALTQALAAINSPYMQPRRIGLALYGLQLAAQLLKHTAATEPNQSVRVCEETSDGIELAPSKEVCEPPRDCRHCPRQDTCSNYEEPDDDEEEEEEEQDEENDEPGDDDGAEETEENEDEDQDQDDSEEDEEEEPTPENINRLFIRALRRREKEREAINQRKQQPVSR